MNANVNILNTPEHWPVEVKLAVSEAAASGRVGAVKAAQKLIDQLPPGARGRPFKLAIARTFTLEAQLDSLELALSLLPCVPEILLGPLESIEQSLLNQESELLAQQPDAVLVLWRLEELNPNFFYAGIHWSVAERRNAIQSIVDRIASLCRAYSGAAPLFISTLPGANEFCLRDLHIQDGIVSALAEINVAILLQASEHDRVRILDFAGWANHFGADWYDAKLDLMARQPIAARSLPSFGQWFARTFSPLLFPPAKVLAVDLDNTLWGGVLEEDGVSGLRIGRDFPGNVYWRIQEAARRLKAQGVALALVSKNNLSEVREAFEQQPDLPLRWEDLSAMRVNWQPKHQNLRAIAAELNVGLESFVFLDDQSFEQAEMKHHLPEVEVIVSTGDPLMMLERLIGHRRFDIYRRSIEDTQRQADYQAQVTRRTLASTATNRDVFLKSLEMRVTIQPVSRALVPRALQLLAKTNQFNLTTRRHNESALNRLLKTERAIHLCLHLQDRLSDQGIVGLVLTRPVLETNSLHIDSFILSCRALDRDVEVALFSELVRRAHEGGFTELQAEFIPTCKNQRVEKFYEGMGMTALPGAAKGKIFRMQLPADCPASAHLCISREE